jgi:hypothetical protein
MPHHECFEEKYDICTASGYNWEVMYTAEETTAESISTIQLLNGRLLAVQAFRDPATMMENGPVFRALRKRFLF